MRRERGEARERERRGGDKRRREKSKDGVREGGKGS